MGVPDRILGKKGPLTDDEWEVMRKHPTFAFELLSRIAYLRPALDIPYCHHERWDGTGYPRRLAGEQIPLAARIFSVVDAWESLRTNRPFREAWSDDKAREFLKEQSGHQFDPRVVDAFMRILAHDERLAPT
jgi:response regulator RpfG family c-di-GMP phosphodiesterase